MRVNKRRENDGTSGTKTQCENAEAFRNPGRRRESAISCSLPALWLSWVAGGVSLDPLKRRAELFHFVAPPSPSCSCQIRMFPAQRIRRRTTRDAWNHTSCKPNLQYVISTERSSGPGKLVLKCGMSPEPGTHNRGSTIVGCPH